MTRHAENEQRCNGRGWLVVALVLALADPAFAGSGSSLAFFVNDPADYDYGLQLVLPATFGTGEFTFELWIRPDDSFPVGSTASGAGQRLNWSDADNEPYSSGSWWFEGNFLLDGHNNNTFEDGTFSLQLYGGGRLRWLFGDGAIAGAGGHWSVGAYPASTVPSLLDGRWHQVTLVRRWAAGGGADLELWIDGVQIAVESTPLRTDMRGWWDAWPGFPAGQEGWFWAVEKQAAIGVLSQYEDYKGPLDEVRFWSRAKSAGEIRTRWEEPVVGTEAGLVGWYRLDEGAGTTTCDALAPASCISLVDPRPGVWSTATPPVLERVFDDGFESGGSGGWSATVTGGP